MMVDVLIVFATVLGAIAVVFAALVAIQRLLSLSRSGCLHTYDRWRTYEELGESRSLGGLWETYIETRQRRECTKCGRAQDRLLKYGPDDADEQEQDERKETNDRTKTDHSEGVK